jgi:hypothetical protein
MEHNQQSKDYTQFNLHWGIEHIENELRKRPEHFNINNQLGTLIEKTAIALADIRDISYENAQQIILNYCLHYYYIALFNQLDRQYILDRIRMLINAGADVNSFYNPVDKSDPQHHILTNSAKSFGNNKTPLILAVMLAVRTMNTEAINLLKEFQADPTLQDSKGNTALIIAIKNRAINTFDIVKTLIADKYAGSCEKNGGKRKQDTDTCEENVNFPEALQIAEQAWPTCPLDVLNSCIKPFFDNGINIQNNDGYTALMYVAERSNSRDLNDYAIANYLIANGADTTLQNNSGKTAFELAPINTPIKELLRRHLH